jgi:hypothetical protein
MTSRHTRILFTVLKWGILVEAAYFILVYVYVASSRIPYPYELEWMEGGTLDHVRRVIAGEAIYIKPSLEFVPFVYTPFYYYVAAVFARVLGVGFTSLRLVSFLSSVGCFAVIFMFVRRETGNLVAGFIASALFAASFRIGGAWLDLARVDSLFLLLMLSSIYVLRTSESVWTSVIAALLLVLSFLTKQSALFMWPFLSVYALLTFKKYNRFVFPAAFAVLTILCVAVADSSSKGWFSYYIFDLPSQHGLMAPYRLTFWTDDILKQVGIAFGISLFYLIQLTMSDSKRRDVVSMWSIFAGMILSSWISRLHLGGYDDVLLPAYAAIAIVFGLGLNGALRGFDSSRASQGDFSGSVRDRRKQAAVTASVSVEKSTIGLLVLVLAFVQFPALYYNPIEQIPTKADQDTGTQIVQMIQGIDGEVFISGHGYLAELAGKKILRSRCGNSRCPARDRFNHFHRAEQHHKPGHCGQAIPGDYCRNARLGFYECD